MKTYFTSDPHFGHARIIELCDRPFSSVEEMNEEMVRRFNEVVGPDARLVILGDLCMGKLEDSLPYLGKLQVAELVLVPGNHDRWSLAYHHKGTDEEKAAKREAFRDRYEAASGGIALADWEPSRWSFGELTMETHEVLGRAVFSHYPYEGDSQGEDRAGFLRAPDDGRPIIHGHVHGEWRVRGRQFNVGVDVNDFRPVSEDELAAWIEEID